MASRPRSGFSPVDLRCPLCCNTDFHDRPGGWRECTHCEAAFDHSAITDPDGARRSLWAHATGALLPSGIVLNPVAERNLDFATTRAGARSVNITLAAIARPTEVESFLKATAPIAEFFAERLIVVDAASAAADRLSGVRVLARPLAGDFAAQRNFLMDAVHSDWVLQLDTDESLTPDNARQALVLAERAKTQGLRALGLPRRNFVDGVLASLYPDIQYRLLRNDVRFSGVVHERPVVAFEDTALGLSCPIDHALSRDRVRERSAQYAAMAADGERLQDEAALLEPMPERWMAFL